MRSPSRRTAYPAPSAPDATACAHAARAASTRPASISTATALRILTPQTIKAAPKEPPLSPLTARDREPERDQNVNVELGVGIGGGAFGAAAGFFAADLRFRLPAAFFFVDFFPAV